MNLDSTIHADPTVGRYLTLPTSFASQVPSMDQSDRKVPINLRQSGPTPVEGKVVEVPFRPSANPSARERAKTQGRDSAY